METGTTSSVIWTNVKCKVTQNQMVFLENSVDQILDAWKQRNQTKQIT